MLFSGTFPGQNYYFPGRSIQYLKVINKSRYVRKMISYLIMYNRLLTFLWYIIDPPLICSSLVFLGQCSLQDIVTAYQLTEQ